MARIRTIKPDFFTHPEIVPLSIPARLFFLALLCFADDEGRLYDQPAKLGVLAFGDSDDVDPDDLLTELSDGERILRYEVGSKALIQILNFTKHQRINRKTESTHPSPPLTDPSVNPHDRNGGEGNGGEGKSPAETQADDFDEFWDAYPRRKGKKLEKAKAVEAWSRLKEQQRNQALVAVGHYRVACEGGLHLAKDAFRWLRDRLFEEWMEPAVEDKPQEPKVVTHIESATRPKCAHGYDHIPNLEAKGIYACAECEALAQEAS